MNEDFNQKLRQKISEDILSDEDWKGICYAIAYDAASSVRWAAHFLKIIYLKLLDGHQIFIPKLNVTLDINNFKEFVISHFEVFMYNEIMECDIHRD